MQNFYKVVKIVAFVHRIKKDTISNTSQNNVTRHTQNRIDHPVERIHKHNIIYEQRLCISSCKHKMFSFKFTAVFENKEYFIISNIILGKWVVMFSK